MIGAIVLAAALARDVPPRPVAAVSRASVRLVVGVARVARPFARVSGAIRGFRGL